MSTESAAPDSEFARLGTEIIQQRIEPTLGPEYDGKYVAVDVASGDFEVHEDDYTAIMTLKARLPEGTISWLGRIRRPSAYSIGWHE